MSNSHWPGLHPTNADLLQVHCPGKVERGLALIPWCGNDAEAWHQALLQLDTCPHCCAGTLKAVIVHAQDDLKEAAAASRADPEAGNLSSAAAGALGQSQAAPEAASEGPTPATDAESPPHEPEGADPTLGMSEKQKRLWNLQQKLQHSRKANQGAVIAEKKREQVPFDLI